MAFTKLLVVDGQPIVLLGIRAHFGSNLGMGVTDTLYGQNALALYERRKPNVVILEVSLPDSYGPDIARDIRTFDNGARIVFFTNDYTPLSALEAAQAGALGFLKKSSSASELETVVRAAAENRRCLPHDLLQEAAVLRSSPQISADSLTVREKAILRALAGAKNVKQIASELQHPIKHIQRSCGSLKRRLNAPSQENLVRIAKDLGLVS